MRILVLGGGSNQLDLIRKIKENHDDVILCDYLPDCPGRHLADHHLLVSTFDEAGVLQAAEDYQVDGIVTAGTDQPVLTAARVSAQLGLPFYADPQLALAVTHKQVMKQRFTQHGIPTVDYAFITADFTDDQLAHLTFPVVMKPVDCQGQRGVYKLQSIADVRDHIASTLSYSRENIALVENYYPNDEITVNGWVHEGQLHILSVVDRVTMVRDHHIGICLCHHFPSVHWQAHQQAIQQITKDIVDAFHIENGPIYFQYLIGTDGVKVNEIAMRIGGAYEGITLPIIAGVDILQMVIDWAKSGRIDTAALDQFDLHNNAVYLSTQLYFCKPGQITDTTPLQQLQSLPGMRAVYSEYQTGDTIPIIENATARAGYMIIEGRSFEEMIDRVNHAFDQYHIMAGTADLLIRYKDYTGKYQFYDGVGC